MLGKKNYLLLGIIELDDQEAAVAMAESLMLMEAASEPLIEESVAVSLSAELSEELPISGVIKVS